MHVDDLGHGIPEAVMITKRVDGNDMKCFISKVEETFGSITTHTFM